MDSSLFDPAVPLIIQGITGRAGRTHAQLMQRYGTRVAGGVATSGQSELFGGPASREALAIPAAPAWLPAERMQKEYDAVGDVGYQALIGGFTHRLRPGSKSAMVAPNQFIRREDAIDRGNFRST